MKSIFLISLLAISFSCSDGGKNQTKLIQSSENLGISSVKANASGHALSRNDLDSLLSKNLISNSEYNQLLALVQD